VRVLSTLVSVSALCLMVGNAFGAPVATVVPGPGRSHNGGAPCEFQEDSRTVIVTAEGKELTRLDFCSSYGAASADVVTDGRGKNFLLLRHGEGRGTNAVQEYLTIFTIAKDLVAYVRTPVSAGAGPQSRWHYRYRVITSARGGLRLTLTLHIEGTDAIWVPSEKVRTIVVASDDS
jgi:hypothetical protein